MADERRYVNSIDRILHLRSVPFFTGLSAGEVAAVAEHLIPRSHRPGAVLFAAGHLVGAGHSIAEGRVALRQDGKTVAHAGPFDAVGMTTMFSDQPADYDAVAETDSVTLEIPRDPLLEVFEDQFSILRHVLATGAGILIGARRKLPHAGFQPAPTRIDAPPRRPLDLVERLLLLRGNAPFARGSVNALAEMVRHQSELRLPPGAVLWRPGDPADHMLVVLAGAVVCETEDGQSFAVGSRQGLGALDALSGLRRWYRATVTHDFVALRSNVEGMLDVLEDNVDLGVSLLGALARDARTLLPAGTFLKRA